LEASSAALGERLTEIRANLPAPEPTYEDPVPFIEAMPEPDVLRIAAVLTFVRPLTPYPNWYFDVDWQNSDLGYRIRRSIWTYFSRRKIFAALDVPWYGGLKLRMYLGNDQSRQQFVAGCLDPNEFALLDKLLTPGMVFLDVGANEGFYTVFASRCVGETGSVWAFEPSRREMEHLTANVRLNGLANVRSFCVALANEDTEAELLIAGEEHSGHNTLGQFVYDSGLITVESVPVRRLDSLLQECPLERLDFLKIDAEGAEMRVLAGACDALRRFRPLILLEMNDPSLKAQGSSRDLLIQLLESNDYRLYLFDPTTGLPVPAFEGRCGDNMLAVPMERNLPESALLPLPAIGR
jgi:FkbM family methyltransferase